MEDVVAELKKLIDFKDTLEAGDIALLAAEEPQMLAFAVVKEISRDFSRKDEWWHVSMHMLSVPLQPMTWTLRMDQMCGQEIFTMGGKKRFMAPVRIPYESTGPGPLPDLRKDRKGAKGKTKLRVVK